ncbi:SURF1 family cytochrome oxidase biogenesis protein [Subtercola frigoramans]|uniref:SURF1-like protein n=1 Tax=Subtercola frigoramans TaxID=120298 RepID=A0ABS2L5H3_9MICO|nr:SURF1 family protein [Subtercola frigoramans]MBM7472264.1 cytochrome oxidase assembly protein ShyY1 [Subtercola frigoramans]
MIEERATIAERRAEVEPRRGVELAQPVARPRGPVAVYDTVTEGMGGWQFLRTGRWFGFIAATILFAILCVFLANWQWERGQQASADNDIVAANFAADPVPIETALPTLASYDASQNWQRVSVSGIYRADDELVVRNRSNEGANGFEVITPLELSDGSVLMVDRGWVAPSPDDSLAPGTIPNPASGSVNLVVQLRPSEAPLGSVTPTGNQIGSITLPRVQQAIGGNVYVGAYGVLDSPSAAVDAGLASTQTTMPTEDVGLHYSYMVQWLSFALLGFGVLGFAIRKEYRRLNSDDPDERARATERVRKRARKAFTDEELEDEAIDGYLPLTRWGIAGSSAAATSASRGALTGERAGLDAEGATGALAPASSAAPEIYVIEAKPAEGDDESDIRD